MEFQELSKNIQKHIEYAEKNNIDTIAFSILSRKEDREFYELFQKCTYKKLNIAEVVKLIEKQNWTEMEKGMCIVFYIHLDEAEIIPALPDSALTEKK